MPMLAAWARLLASSLNRRLSTHDLTVSCDTKSRWAICLFRNPSAMSWSTSASRFVNFSWKLDEAGDVRKLRGEFSIGLTTTHRAPVTQDAPPKRLENTVHATCFPSSGSAAVRLFTSTPYSQLVGRSVVGLCAVFGLIAGSYLPVLWGASSFSLSSILFSVLGGIAGVWIGIRLSDV